MPTRGRKRRGLKIYMLGFSQPTTMIDYLFLLSSLRPPGAAVMPTRSQTKGPTRSHHPPSYRSQRTRGVFTPLRFFSDEKERIGPGSPSRTPTLIISFPSPLSVGSCSGGRTGGGLRPPSRTSPPRSASVREASKSLLIPVQGPRCAQFPPVSKNWFVP